MSNHVFGGKKPTFYWKQEASITSCIDRDKKNLYRPRSGESEMRNCNEELDDKLSTRFHLNTARHFFMCRWVSTGTGCPEAIEYPWKASKATCTWSWLPCSGCLCLRRGWTRWTQRSLPTSAILGLSGYISMGLLSNGRVFTEIKHGEEKNKMTEDKKLQLATYWTTVILWSFFNSMDWRESVNWISQWRWMS